MTQKILHLNVKKECFDGVLDKSIKYNHRCIKPFWTKRLFNEDGSAKNYDLINLKNGYSKDAPNVQVEFLGVGFGKSEGKKVYEIKLGKIL